MPNYSKVTVFINVSRFQHCLSVRNQLLRIQEALGSILLALNGLGLAYNLTAI
jgi:hypothetical protein